MIIHWLIMWMAIFGQARVSAGLGTVFGSSKWDTFNPHSELSCLHREIDDQKDVVVALPPDVPCGSVVWIWNPRTKRSAVARKQDAGPRSALVDMSKLLAKRLRHNGHERVVMMVMPPRMLLPRTQVSDADLVSREKIAQEP